MNWSEVRVPKIWIPEGLSLLENMTAEYKESGELTGPLTKQLENSLKQAKHHLEKGSVKQSVKFIEKFMFHLNRKPNQDNIRSEEHTSELQSRGHLVCRLLLEKKKKNKVKN